MQRKTWIGHKRTLNNAAEYADLRGIYQWDWKVSVNAPPSNESDPVFDAVNCYIAVCQRALFFVEQNEALCVTKKDRGVESVGLRIIRGCMKLG
jgi:hypothetical protein